ncbi:1-aminocyclopropane-1-carboxylate synthase-like protein 1 [Aphelenchoides besseyi]|nr:1-aminocyclopropane-1-carboxylate synthase-like protein 1 [Aphelenchoides besseyi]
MIGLALASHSFLHELEERRCKKLGHRSADPRHPSRRRCSLCHEAQRHKSIHSTASTPALSFRRRLSNPFKSKAENKPRSSLLPSGSPVFESRLFKLRNATHGQLSPWIAQFDSKSQLLKPPETLRSASPPPTPPNDSGVMSLSVPMAQEAVKTFNYDSDAQQSANQVGSLGRASDQIYRYTPSATSSRSASESDSPIGTTAAGPLDTIVVPRAHRLLQSRELDQRIQNEIKDDQWNPKTNPQLKESETWNGTVEAIQQPAKAGGLDWVKHKVNRYIESFISAPKDPPLLTESLTIIPGNCAAHDTIDALLASVPLGSRLIDDFEERAHVQVIPVEFDHDPQPAFQRSLKEAERRNLTVKAIAFNNPYPSVGADLSEIQILELCKWAVSKNLFIIADEVFASSVAADSNEFRSVLSLRHKLGIRQRKKVVWIWSVSTELCLPGAQFSVLHCENRDLQKALRRLEILQPCAPVVQTIVANLLDDLDWLTEFYKEKTQRLEENRKFVLNKMSEYEIRCFESTVSLFVFLNLNQFLESDSWEAEQKLWRRFSRAGVFLQPGRLLGISTFGYFRLVISSPKDELEEGLKRLHAILLVLEKRSPDEFKAKSPPPSEPMVARTRSQEELMRSIFQSKAENDQLIRIDDSEPKLPEHHSPTTPLSAYQLLDSVFTQGQVTDRSETPEQLVELETKRAEAIKEMIDYVEAEETINPSKMETHHLLANFGEKRLMSDADYETISASDSSTVNKLKRTTTVQSTSNIPQQTSTTTNIEVESTVELTNRITIQQQKPKFVETTTYMPQCLEVVQLRRVEDLPLLPADVFAKIFVQTTEEEKVKSPKEDQSAASTFSMPTSFDRVSLRSSSTETLKATEKEEQPSVQLPERYASTQHDSGVEDSEIDSQDRRRQSADSEATIAVLEDKPRHDEMSNEMYARIFVLPTPRDEGKHFRASGNQRPDQDSQITTDLRAFRQQTNRETNQRSTEESTLSDHDLERVFNPKNEVVDLFNNSRLIEESGRRSSIGHTEVKHLERNEDLQKVELPKEEERVAEQYRESTNPVDSGTELLTKVFEDRDEKPISEFSTKRDFRHSEKDDRITTDLRAFSRHQEEKRKLGEATLSDHDLERIFNPEDQLANKRPSETGHNVTKIEEKGFNDLIGSEVQSSNEQLEQNVKDEQPIVEAAEDEQQLIEGTEIKQSTVAQALDDIPAIPLESVETKNLETPKGTFDSVSATPEDQSVHQLEQNEELEKVELFKQKDDKPEKLSTERRRSSTKSTDSGTELLTKVFEHRDEEPASESSIKRDFRHSEKDDRITTDLRAFSRHQEEKRKLGEVTLSDHDLERIFSPEKQPIKEHASKEQTDGSVNVIKETNPSNEVKALALETDNKPVEESSYVVESEFDETTNVEEQSTDGNKQEEYKQLPADEALEEHVIDDTLFLQSEVATEGVERKSLNRSPTLQEDLPVHPLERNAKLEKVDLLKESQSANQRRLSTKSTDSGTELLTKVFEHRDEQPASESSMKRDFRHSEKDDRITTDLRAFSRHQEKERDVGQPTFSDELMEEILINEDTNDIGDSKATDVDIVDLVFQPQTRNQEVKVEEKRDFRHSEKDHRITTDLRAFSQHQSEERRVGSVESTLTDEQIAEIFEPKKSSGPQELASEIPDHIHQKIVEMDETIIRELETHGPKITTDAHLFVEKQIAVKEQREEKRRHELNPTLSQSTVTEILQTTVEHDDVKSKVELPSEEKDEGYGTSKRDQGRTKEETASPVVQDYAKQLVDDAIKKAEFEQTDRVRPYDSRRLMQMSREIEKSIDDQLVQVDKNPKEQQSKRVSYVEANDEDADRVATAIMDELIDDITDRDKAKDQKETENLHRTDELDFENLEKYGRVEDVHLPYGESEASPMWCPEDEQEEDEEVEDRLRTSRPSTNQPTVELANEQDVRDYKQQTAYWQTDAEIEHNQEPLPDEIFRKVFEPPKPREQTKIENTSQPKKEVLDEVYTLKPLLTDFSFIEEIVQETMMRRQHHQYRPDIDQYRLSMVEETSEASGTPISRRSLRGSIKSYELAANRPVDELQKVEEMKETPLDLQPIIENQSSDGVEEFIDMIFGSLNGSSSSESATEEIDLRPSARTENRKTSSTDDFAQIQTTDSIDETKESQETHSESTANQSTEQSPMQPLHIDVPPHRSPRLPSMKVNESDRMEDSGIGSDITGLGSITIEFPLQFNPKASAADSPLFTADELRALLERPPAVVSTTVQSTVETPTVRSPRFVSFIDEDAEAKSRRSAWLRHEESPQPTPQIYSEADIWKILGDAHEQKQVKPKRRESADTTDGDDWTASETQSPVAPKRLPVALRRSSSSSVDLDVRLRATTSSPKTTTANDGRARISIRESDQRTAERVAAARSRQRRYEKRNPPNVKIIEIEPSAATTIHLYNRRVDVEETKGESEQKEGATKLQRLRPDIRVASTAHKHRRSQRHKSQDGTEITYVHHDIVMERRPKSLPPNVERHFVVKHTNITEFVFEREKSKRQLQNENEEDAKHKTEESESDAGVYFKSKSRARIDSHGATADALLNRLVFDDSGGKTTRDQNETALGYVEVRHRRAQNGERLNEFAIRKQRITQSEDSEDLPSSSASSATEFVRTASGRHRDCGIQTRRTIRKDQPIDFCCRMRLVKDKQQKSEEGREFLVCKNPQHQDATAHCDPRRLYTMRRPRDNLDGRLLLDSEDYLSISTSSDSSNSIDRISVRHSPGATWFVSSVCRTSRFGCDRSAVKSRRPLHSTPSTVPPPSTISRHHSE